MGTCQPQIEVEYIIPPHILSALLSSTNFSDEFPLKRGELKHATCVSTRYWRLYFSYY